MDPRLKKLSPKKEVWNAGTVAAGIFVCCIPAGPVEGDCFDAVSVAIAGDGSRLMRKLSDDWEISL